MDTHKKTPDKEDYISYKDNFLSKLQEYGKIDHQRNFNINIQGKNRKYPIIITDNTQIDLVNALKEKTGYSFFFYEDEDFYTFNPLGTPRKKEIYYNKEEIHTPGFFLSLFHEVGHYPTNDWISDLEEEKKAWIKAIQIASKLKNTYNTCFLAGFKDHQDIYNYTRKFIKTYEERDKIRQGRGKGFSQNRS